MSILGRVNGNRENRLVAGIVKETLKKLSTSSKGCQGNQLVDLILEALGAVEAGDDVTVITKHHELTTKQAAEFLNVSRPFLVKLLDSGVIPCRKVGRHRRIMLQDIENFRIEQESKSRKFLKQLVEESEEMKLY